MLSHRTFCADGELKFLLYFDMKNVRNDGETYERQKIAWESLCTKRIEEQKENNGNEEERDTSKRREKSADKHIVESDSETHACVFLLSHA